MPILVVLTDSAEIVPEGVNHFGCSRYGRGVLPSSIQCARGLLCTFQSVHRGL